jgi:hypothetical protein
MKKKAINIQEQLEETKYEDNIFDILKEETNVFLINESSK